MNSVYILLFLTSCSYNHLGLSNISLTKLVSVVSLIEQLDYKVRRWGALYLKIKSWMW